MSTFGLIGRNIEYSFSKKYFDSFFKSKNLNHNYLNFDIQSLDQLQDIIHQHPDLKGFNVTIPFKEEIIPYLYKIDKEAKKIGAVNMVKISKNKNLIGYNTDHYGFAKSLIEHFPIQNKKALILGTGGASKAIAYVLNNLNYTFQFVSRNKTPHLLTYDELNEKIISDHLLIINCTPLGTDPNINTAPKLPYEAIGHNHLLFDLTYNPKLTVFLKFGKDRGARIVNGEDMLLHQAKKSWEIWKS